MVPFLTLEDLNSMHLIQKISSPVWWLPSVTQPSRTMYRQATRIRDTGVVMRAVMIFLTGDKITTSEAEAMMVNECEG